MAPSETDDAEEPETETLLDSLAPESAVADRRRAAESLSRRAVTGNWWDGRGDLPASTVEALVGALDDPDPEVRGHVAGVLVLYGLYCATEPGSEPFRTVAGRVVDLATDDDWRVRVTVRLPLFWDVLRPALVDGSLGEGTAERATRALVDGLADPVDLVRKRSGQVLVGEKQYPNVEHDAALFLEHPDPVGAVPTLVDALDDPVDGVTGAGTRGRGARHTAGAILAALGEHAPEVLEPHLADVAPALDHWDDRVRADAVEALAPLLDRDPDLVHPFLDACEALVTGADGGLAAGADRLPAERAVRSVDRAVAVRPDAAPRVERILLAGLRTGETSHRVDVPGAAAAAAARAARVAPEAFPEPFRRLAEHDDPLYDPDHEADAADPRDLLDLDDDPG